MSADRVFWSYPEGSSDRQTRGFLINCAEVSKCRRCSLLIPGKRLDHRIRHDKDKVADRSTARYNECSRYQRKAQKTPPSRGMTPTFFLCWCVCIVCTVRFFKHVTGQDRVWSRDWLERFEIKLNLRNFFPISYLVVNACLHFGLWTIYESFDISQYLLPDFLY